MELVKVVFLRHGESEWNKLNLFCGWHDVNLSEKGKSDASAISAAALRQHSLKFDVAFTSALKRAQQSLEIVLNALECSRIPVRSNWRLNERHYGDLTGLNKRQMAEKYGEEKVQIWRRSFNVPPPIMDTSSPYYAAIRNNPNFADIPADEFPDAETLESVMHRVVPYWESEIVTEIKGRKRVLVLAHGTIIRAIVKHIEGISDEKISTINIPNSIPCVYNFDINTMKPVGPMEFLADEKYLQDQLKKTASIGN
ncbi:phosphoglycerate mutase 2-like [Eupeodes corollae]|uniref:phosphoglycerate mutase 2-like n=1 Tax=Eupeodes corollae TaxID=290404 RepID=UPI002492FF39|nr:phosphoglycerate mutase 2-like [Eupeodes corollae]